MALWECTRSSLTICLEFSDSDEGLRDSGRMPATPRLFYLFYLCLFIRSFIELSGHLLSPRYVQALGQARGHCGVRFAVGWGTQPEGMRGTVWVLLLWGLSRAGGADEQCSPWGGLGRLPGGKLGPGG